MSQSPVVRVPLGQVVITSNAAEQLPQAEVTQAIQRHANGDWGDVEAEDRNANDLAIQDGDRILSVFHTTGGIKFWIITESDRSVTTVLLPEDY